MIEALWSVVFKTDLGEGAGIVVMETGRVLGGDMGFTYVGDYHVAPTGQVSGKVRIKRFSPGADLPNVFGPMEDFEISFASEHVSHQVIIGQAQLVGIPGPKMLFRLDRRAELP